MASRDQPVNGRRSTLSLNKRGNLVLRDAGRSTVWTTNTISTSPLQLHLSNTELSSIYWTLGGASYNTSRTAMFDLLGQFHSSDDMEFFTSDFGIGPTRRLTLDYDGNLRLYSLDERTQNWNISWQAISDLCGIHGLCGPNGLCTHTLDGIRCSCPPGFKSKDDKDLSQGREPIFSLYCNPRKSMFITPPDTDFYSYDYNYSGRVTLQECKDHCLHSCICKAFLYHMDDSGSYGIVSLEMVTGKRSFGSDVIFAGEGWECKNLVTWVSEMMSETNGRLGDIEDIIDPEMDIAYDAVKMDPLVRVALYCAEEDKDARPTMSQVVEMLLHNEIDA
ncbi:hypothetical protein AAC387_Pa11g0104 [Persea americana]